VLKRSTYPYYTSTYKDFYLLNNPYGFHFNGKEMDAEGIGGGGSTYDYGFRIYNPNLGKFLSVDPFAKKYVYYSTYQFTGNSPIQFIDADGAEPAKMKIDGFEQGPRDGAFAGRNMSENPVVITKARNQKAIGEIRPYESNAIESFKEQNLTINPSDGIVKKSFKVAGGVLYQSANDAAIYGSNVLGFDPVDLEGHVHNRGSDLLDAGIGTITNFLPVEKAINLLANGGKKAINYSTFVGKMLSKSEKGILSQESKNNLFLKNNEVMDNLSNLKSSSGDVVGTTKDAGDATKEVSKGKQEK